MVRKSKKREATLAARAARETSVYSAGIYRRLSSDDTKKRGDSLETQQNITETYIAAAPDIHLVL